MSQEVQSSDLADDAEPTSDTRAFVIVSIVINPSSEDVCVGEAERGGMEFVGAGISLTVKARSSRS